MKIGIVTRENTAKWGGDLRAVQTIVEGMRSLGLDVCTGATALHLVNADFLFITNTCINQRTNLETLKLFEKRFGTIGFHEDCIKCDGPSLGLPTYIARCLGAGLASDDGFECHIERLFETPEIIYYYAPSPKKTPIFNYELLKSSEVCIANSETEAKILLRDCPSCSPKVVPLTAGIDVLKKRGDSPFLEHVGLSSGSYILQVGRLEPRKNQLATILATKDLDIPLVLIATHGFFPEYEELCLEAIKKWRKAPTVILSQTIKPQIIGHLRVIPMPQEEILPREWIDSAFFHAGLHVHPAFSETPGYIFFESVAVNVPTLASEWCTIKDYGLGNLVTYALPYHLEAIKDFVVRNFGKRLEGGAMAPIFQRTSAQMAQEIVSCILSH